MFKEQGGMYMRNLREKKESGIPQSGKETTYNQCL